MATMTAAEIRTSSNFIKGQVRVALEREGVEVSEVRFIGTRIGVWVPNMEHAEKAKGLLDAAGYPELEVIDYTSAGQGCLVHSNIERGA